MVFFFQLKIEPTERVVNVDGISDSKFGWAALSPETEHSVDEGHESTLCNCCGLDRCISPVNFSEMAAESSQAQLVNKTSHRQKIPPVNPLNSVK